MKDKKYTLTQTETEELCRLYMDCNLTVKEEAELQYVLGKLAYASPLIEDVRALMGIQIASALKLNAEKAKKRRVWNFRWVAGIAASVVILLGVSLKVASDFNHKESDDDVYIAYSNGVELKGAQLMAQIERDNAKAEAFLKRMDEIEAQEKKIYGQIFNE